MADLDDLFRNGPPGRRELEQWLRTNSSASSAEVEDVLAAYDEDEDIGATEFRNRLAQTYSIYEDTVVDVAEGRAPPPTGRGDTQTGVDFGELATAGAEGGGYVAPHSRPASSGSSPPRSRSGAPPWLGDVGPSVDPEALGTSIAIGQVFTDAEGNPILDESGQPTPVNAQTLWEAIKGTRFDMGALTIRTRRPPTEADHPTSIVSRSQQLRRWTTPSQMMAMLGSMDEDYLTRLQQQMLEAGLYGDGLPSWGVADEGTRQALMGLFAEASITPDEPVDRVIARLVDEQVRRGAQAGTDGSGDAGAPVFQPEVTSAETLGALIDDISQDLVGEFVDPARKDALIAQLQGREVDTQRQAFSQDVAAQGGAGADIDAFMTAIAGGETTAAAGGGYGTTNQIGAHGRYQIMPANWGPWAERAGLSRSAPQTPENQEIVARHVMLQYYNQFGNWRDVAIAWFAGPGAVGAAGAEGRRDANGMTVQAYADNAMGRFAGLRGQPAPAGAVGETPAVVRFDPEAEAEAILRAQDPAGWEAHAYAKRATEFYQLLGGVVGG